MTFQVPVALRACCIETVSRFAREGIAGLKCQTCKFYVVTEGKDWFYEIRCACGCNGVLSEHDDRAEGPWHCPECGNDSDTDFGALCTACAGG